MSVTVKLEDWRTESPLGHPLEDVRPLLGLSRWHGSHVLLAGPQPAVNPGAGGFRKDAVLSDSCNFHSWRAISA